MLNVSVGRGDPDWQLAAPSPEESGALGWLPGVGRSGGTEPLALGVSGSSESSQCWTPRGVPTYTGVSGGGSGDAGEAASRVLLLTPHDPTAGSIVTQRERSRWLVCSAGQASWPGPQGRARAEALGVGSRLTGEPVLPGVGPGGAAGFSQPGRGRGAAEIDDRGGRGWGALGRPAPPPPQTCGTAARREQGTLRPWNIPVGEQVPPCDRNKSQL